MSSSPRARIGELNSDVPLSGSAIPAKQSLTIGISPSPIQEGKLPLPADKHPTESPALQSNIPLQVPSAQPKSPDAHPNPPKPRTKAAPTPIDQNTVFWKAYNDAGDLEDKEFVKAAGSDLDALLIFAGLFSATNTAFIIESYKNLKLDPADKTNELLQSLLSVAQNPQAAISSTPFVASPRDIRINACFFVSLCCSLSAAFGAVLAKQWLTQYDEDSGGTTLKEPANRGRERQRKYKGRDQWHLEDVIVTLPTLLQFSLFFFFVGLIDFLWPLNNIVTSIALGFTITTFFFYVATIIISIVNPSAPFQTRLSRLLRRLRPQRLKTISPEDVRDTNIECLVYLLDRATKLRDALLANAFVSLSDELGTRADTVIASLVDFHLKPVLGKGWSIPTLYGDDRVPLLKIVEVLVKKWRVPGHASIQTPLYNPLDTTALLQDLPNELLRAFLANPGDAESCQYIVDTLLTLHPDDTPSPYHRDIGVTAWQAAWLQGSVTKGLQDADPVVQQNTLAVLAVATRDCVDRKEVWGIVRRAKKESPALIGVIGSVVWKEISVIQPQEVLDGLNSPRLFEWMLASGDMEDLSGAAEFLQDSSGTTTFSSRALISKVVEMIVSCYLKPVFDDWWRLPGLHGSRRQSLLRALHVIIVRWNYLEASLNATSPVFRLHHSLSPSLRIELWQVFLEKPEDSEIAWLIAGICLKIPTPVVLDNDKVGIAALQKLSTNMTSKFLDNEAKPIVLAHCLWLLCSNADSLITSANLQNVHLVPGTPHGTGIPEYLRVTMWVGDTADLEDFWRATIRVHLLPLFFPNELKALRFAKYLHLWFQCYTNPNVGTQLGHQVSYWETTREGMKQAQLYWSYLLSLQRMCPNAESSQQSEELKAELIEYGHQFHLLGLLNNAHHHSYPTWLPLALHLLLSLQNNDTSNVHVEVLNGVVNAIASGSLSPSLTLQDLRKYNQSLRAADVSDEEWCNSVWYWVATGMVQMVTRVKGVSRLGPGEASDGLDAPHLLEWMAVSGSIEELADALGTLSCNSSGVGMVPWRLVDIVVEILVQRYLKPALDGWWRLPGLHGPDAQSLLRIIYTVTVRWRDLEAGLDNNASEFRSLRPFISSLRTELFEVFLAGPRTPEDLRKITEIWESLPSPEPFYDDEISKATVRKVVADISALLGSSGVQPAVLNNCLALLHPNLSPFHTIRSALGTSRSIPQHLRSTMWDGDEADLEDFGRATFRVHVLLAFFPDELRTLKFHNYLYLWLERYHRNDRYNLEYNQMQRLPMCWAYLLSLQQMLSTVEAPTLAKELKGRGHQSHLENIYDHYNSDPHDTCPLLALYLLLCLWSHDTSDIEEGHVMVVLGNLWMLKLSLAKVMEDFRMYAQSSRAENLSDEQWGEEVSGRVARDMGQMVKWLYSYMEAAAPLGRTLERSPYFWPTGRANYGSWCNELDKQLGTDEYGQLAETFPDFVPYSPEAKIEEVEP